MDKIEKIVRSHLEIEHLKRKLEGNMTECCLVDEDCTSANKTMNRALLLI
ncbi:hypothetical protein [Methanococcoides sp. FTZ1]